MHTFGTGKSSPKQRLDTISRSSATSLSDEGTLHLRTIIGTTTTSINAFDVLPLHNQFACCAGPAVLLFQVDEELRTHQRIYRARPGITPIHTTTSFYNPSTPPSTPSRSRHISPFKYSSARANLFSENFSDVPVSHRTKDRSREATCLSLNSNGTLIAIGENSLAPQVAIWSTAQDSHPDVPLSLLTDHSGGIQSVAFSRDSRWLCSLGNAFDGFIFLYSINPKTGAAKLHASNKCSNAKTITWMGNRLITAGTRHVKVWKFGGNMSESPAKGRRDLESTVSMSPGSPALFRGRNCLLGSLLLEATFTCVMPISDQMAALCTATGDVCLLDESDKLQRIGQLQFDIRCACYDAKSDLLWVGGTGDKIVGLAIHYPQDTTMPISVTVSCNLAPLKDAHLSQQPCTVAIGSLSDSIVTIDSDRIVSMRKLERKDGAYELARNAHRMPAHESAVLGVCVVSLAGKPGFLTYSAQGKILFWILDGTCCGSVEIDLFQPAPIEGQSSNELKKLIAPKSDELLYAGDKLGIFQILDRCGTKIAEIQAHSGELNSIAVATLENQTILSTCGRDRTVQLFSRHDRSLNHLQTLDDHAANVTDVRFLDEASLMLSISSDRSVIIRQAVKEEATFAFIMVRAVMLKASPVSFNTVPTDPSMVVVSTMDRQVHKIDISSGRILSFKPANGSSGDTAVINSLEVHDIDNKSPLLLGVSSTDKTIRVYDYKNGILLAKEYGQTPMSAISMISNQETDESDQRLSLITCGYDGTIGIWDLKFQHQRPLHELEGCIELESPVKVAPYPVKPVRKILSKIEVLDMQRSLETEKGCATPARTSPLPSHIHRKPSTYSVANSSRVGLVAPSSETHVTAAILNRRTSQAGISNQQNGHATESFHRKALKAHPSSPLTDKAPKFQRPSLDHRRRSKSAANLNKLNDMAVDLCESLQTFRERIMPSVAEKIDPKTLVAVEIELASTARAVSEMTLTSQNTPFREDSFGDYLTQMIDKRLALKAKSLEVAQSTVEDNTD